MSNCQCVRKCNCTLWSVIAAVAVGVLAAFLQITGMITVTTAFLWVLLGIAVGYLAVLVVSTALSRWENGCECGNRCLCTLLNALLAGILGTVLFSVVLLAIGVTAGSVLSAILVGLLLLSFSLTVAGSACFVRCKVGCGN